jgi:hypothetical protein
MVIILNKTHLYIILVGIKRASAFWTCSAVHHIRVEIGNFSFPHVGVRVSFLMCYGVARDY